MDRKAFEHDIQEVIADFVELIAKAFFGGLAAAVAMGLAILVLSANAQAATPDHLPGNQPRSLALTPPIDRSTSGVSALWATLAGERALDVLAP
jgi:hypothetical protein